MSCRFITAMSARLKVPAKNSPALLFLRSFSNGVVDMPNVGFYSLPKKMGRTGR